VTDARVRSHLVYAGLVATMAGCLLARGAFEVRYRSAGQRLAFSWPFLAFLAGWGLLGLLLARRAGFPEMWDPPRWRAGAPWALGLGLATGALSILADRLRPLAPLLGLDSLHHPMPEGLLVYLHAGIASEVYLHLLPAPLVTLAATRLLGMPPARAGWAAVALLSVGESWRFLADPAQWHPLEALRHAVSCLANGAEVWLYCRYGFLLGLAQRLASYSIWHVLWPALE
jgi:hypothetical protein